MHVLFGGIIASWELTMSFVNRFSLPMLEWCEIPAGSVTIEGVLCAVPKFYLAKYPLTYAQYEMFVSDKGYAVRAYWTDAGWAWKGARMQPAFWQDCEWHRGDHPVNGVTWYESYAFTQWHSAKTNRHITLPTECQWQRAVQGDDGREYPWGNGFQAARCNTTESALGKTTPVMQYPNGASPFGVLDMSGNVWEWCLSNWTARYQMPEDIANEGTQVRVQRGGAFDFGPKDALAASRDGTNPSNHRSHDGFRIAWLC
jgi:formylglycine-generating enzyme required for sulfatase activity